jgi:endoglucanase
MSVRAGVRAGALLALLCTPGLAAQGTGDTPQRREGGIIRGPTSARRIALEFTGHEFAEGGTVILDELARRGARASFFLTGDFLRTPERAALVRRIVGDGHYLGPHSDKHLLYCDWRARDRTLVTREAFTHDLTQNLEAIAAFGVKLGGVRYWVPAYEWYNADIAAWSASLGLTLVSFTPGTRSNADYAGEADTNFVPSRQIADSILAREWEDPDGLNGYLLLLHIGAGPGRADKMHSRLGSLLDDLSARGYRFVRVDELLR